MKKTLLTLTIAICGYCSYAQYLPLSGGTLTGTLTINEAPLALQSSGINTFAFGSSATVLGSGSATDHLNYVYGNNPFTIWTNSVKRFTINGSGDVAIGATSPLSGGSDASWLTLNGTDVHSGGNIYSINGAAKGYSFVDNDGLLTQQAITGQKFVVNNTTTAVSIATSGNVGIGTTTPDAKLAVNGSIHAKEVKVSLSVPGPDYVFEPDYELIKLSELKAYLEKNKHLPEIQSASNMAKNGIDLGDMNIKLLKKIEELTLYLIEKDQKDKDQQEQINELRALVNKLIKNK